MRKLSSTLFMLLVMSACGGSDAATVEMVGQAFEPGRRTAAPGDTISFKNASSESHTVTAYADEIPPDADYFSSGAFPTEEAARDDLATALVPSGDTYEVTLSEPGTYRYFCIPHEEAGMKGTIVVER